MKPALVKVTEILRSTGMSDEEIDMLMGRFLYEEAQEYVDCMDIVNKSNKEKNILH